MKSLTLEIGNNLQNPYREHMDGVYGTGMLLPILAEARMKMPKYQFPSLYLKYNFLTKLMTGYKA